MAVKFYSAARMIRYSPFPSVTFTAIRIAQSASAIYELVANALLWLYLLIFHKLFIYF